MKSECLSMLFVKQTLQLIAFEIFMKNRNVTKSGVRFCCPEVSVDEEAGFGGNSLLVVTERGDDKL